MIVADPVCVSGRDLIGVQNLMKKHQALQAEITGHDPRITSVCDQGKQMMDEGHFASEEIAQKIQGLTDRWQQLKVTHALILPYSMERVDLSRLNYMEPHSSINPVGMVWLVQLCFDSRALP